jgi:hypothetical protein
MDYEERMAAAFAALDLQESRNYSEVATKYTLEPTTLAKGGVRGKEKDFDTVPGRRNAEKQDRILPWCDSDLYYVNRCFLACCRGAG